MSTDKKKNKKVQGFKEFDPKNYVDIEPRLDEAKQGTAVVAWGRMNPITSGHEKLVNKVIATAKKEKGVPMVFLSHTQDKKKNPLSYEDKIKYAQKAFGSVVNKSNAKTIFQLMKQLEKRFNKVILIAGSDRVTEFNERLNKYNGKEYKFDEIKVVSAGQRNKKSDDVSGISGTKMRGYATTDMSKFTKYLPKRLQGDAEDIAAAVRKGMGMSEETELEEALTRQQRRKRALAMRRARVKIKRGREKASKKRANLDVLKKRARKQAINKMKDRLAASKRYADMEPAEKERIDKRLEKISKSRIEKLAIKLLPSVKRAERERLASRHMKSENKITTKQDPDIKDMSGTQPKGYYKGVEKDKKDDRARHFKKNAKKSDDDPSAYKPAPGDKEAKTKESKHTKNFRKMYGEMNEWVCGQCHAEPCMCANELNEMWGTYVTKRPHMLMDKNNKVKFDKRFKMFKPKEQMTEELNVDELNDLMESTESFISELEENKKGLQNKAKKTGMPYSILKKVYDRGVAAWKGGHRPGTTPEQWGMARVNSFVTKSSGTWGKADKDLAAKVRKEDIDVKFEAFLDEKLKASDDMGTWIKDFQDSDAPQFKGKSKEKRRQMAIAAKLDAEQNEGVEQNDEMFNFSIKSVKKSGLSNVKKAMKSDKTKKDIDDLRARLAKYSSKPKLKAEACGAGEEGTNKLVKRYKKDTPSE